MAKIFLSDICDLKHSDVGKHKFVKKIEAADIVFADMRNIARNGERFEKTMEVVIRAERLKKIIIVIVSPDNPDNFIFKQYIIGFFVHTPKEADKIISAICKK